MNSGSIANGCLSSALKVSTAIFLVSMFGSVSFAQTSSQETVDEVDEIVAIGIRQSLANALDQKRNANNLKEIIEAEDIGKLPDQNLADVLENVTGVQLDRSVGVGSAVQIRGTGDNRIEINGASTVSSGTNRTGISFEDVPAALIKGVEVTKVPEAKTIEGSVGGTINLKTFRGLSLKEPLASLRVDGEYSDLAESVRPRISGTIGNRFETGAGPIGIVLSGSYVEQDVASFNPRFDRDRVNIAGSNASSEDFNFLRTQFLEQQITNVEFETLSFTGSGEWQASDTMKLYVDGTYSSQERLQQASAIFLSGTGAGPAVNATTNTTFETVDLGSIEGPGGVLDLGEIQAVTQGIIGVGQNGNRAANIDPNLRVRSQINPRLTDSLVLSGGAEWESDRLKIVIEGQYSEAITDTPGLQATLDFINPNGPAPTGSPGPRDNGVPGIFDATNGTLQFGIAPGLPETPSTAELLDPANYELRVFNQNVGAIDNSEAAIRYDLSYDLSDSTPFFTSINLGGRWNQNDIERVTGTDALNLAGANNVRPTGTDFGNLIIAGPDNFGDADGRDLFFQDYLQLDPQAAFNTPQSIVDVINGVGIDSVDGVPNTNQAASFEVSEDSLAFYIQGNYDTEAFGVPVRGNLGLRWVDTNVESTGVTVAAGEPLPVSGGSSYNVLLPRWNLVVEPSDDFLIRGGIARDIRRPSFTQLSPSTNFPGNANNAVVSGNPNLDPETVWSFDVNAEYYFSDTGFVSLGLFHKERDGIVISQRDEPAVDANEQRDVTAPCEGGGIFNPVANFGVFADPLPDRNIGICVPLQSFANGSSQSLTGIEAAVQYDLADFEDRLGWASGFGFIGNFTWQDGSLSDDFFVANGDANDLNDLLGRNDNFNTETLSFGTADTADNQVVQFIPLGGLSNYSFNATVFYEKYGINARARYTWRSDFYNLGELQSFGLPRIIDDRGQLNASLSYKINDNFTVAAEGINLIREDRTEFCVNDGALLCDQGLTDRRFVVGIRAKY